MRISNGYSHPYSSYVSGYQARNGSELRRLTDAERAAVDEVKLLKKQ